MKIRKLLLMLILTLSFVACHNEIDEVDGYDKDNQYAYIHLPCVECSVDTTKQVDTIIDYLWKVRDYYVIDIESTGKGGVYAAAVICNQHDPILKQRLDILYARQNFGDAFGGRRLLRFIGRWADDDRERGGDNGPQGYYQIGFWGFDVISIDYY